MPQIPRSSAQSLPTARSGIGLVTFLPAGFPDLETTPRRSRQLTPPNHRDRNRFPIFRSDRRRARSFQQAFTAALAARSPCRISSKRFARPLPKFPRRWWGCSALALYSATAPNDFSPKRDRLDSRADHPRPSPPEAQKSAAKSAPPD